MKRLVLIKQSPAIQLGHLYEHIFCAHVDTFLYEHHLFPFLDYSLTGRTYEGGIIAIMIDLYTDKAIQASDTIASLPIDVNEETIFTAATQILAEKEKPIASTGYDMVAKALTALHDQPWQNIDDLEITDTRRIGKKTGPFYIAEGKPLPARKLTVSTLLDTPFAASHNELLPLFRQIAWLMTASFQGTLSDTYGFFSHDDAFKNTSLTVAVLNSFSVANANDVDVNISDVLDTCTEVVDDLQKYGAFDRFTQELHTTSYYDRADTAPNFEKNYEDTHIFIGSKGWQKIATKENCDLLLQQTSIEIRFGKNKVARSIAKTA